jgi:hypothetical protein
VSGLQTLFQMNRKGYSANICENLFHRTNLDRDIGVLQAKLSVKIIFPDSQIGGMWKIYIHFRKVVNIEVQVNNQH